MSPVTAISDRPAPCAHCATPVVWLPTTYGRSMLFEATPVPMGLVDEADGYVLDRRRRALVNATDVPPGVLPRVGRVLVRHRCEEYLAWREDNDLRISGADLRAWSTPTRTA